MLTELAKPVGFYMEQIGSLKMINGDFRRMKDGLVDILLSYMIDHSSGVEASWLSDMREMYLFLQALDDAEYEKLKGK
jgi:hypothetical protein